MSLIIAVHVEEGIVLASDSRTCLSNPNEFVINSENVMLDNYGIPYNDNSYKTYLCPNNIGLSICGNTDVDVPISDFIRTNITESTDIDNVPNIMKNYFSKFAPTPNLTFFIAGYHNNNGVLEQRIFNYNLKSEPKKEDTTIHNILLGGVFDIIAPIIANNPISIPFCIFTLQNAIDFVQFAIKTTIDTMKFQLRAKTVGGRY